MEKENKKKENQEQKNTQTTQNAEKIWNIEKIEKAYFEYEDKAIPKFLSTCYEINLQGVVGREDDLKKMKEKLDKTNQPLNLTGLGGIGKTTLAKAFLTSYQNAFKHILWIDGRNGIREGFVNNRVLLDNLGLTNTIQYLPKDANYLNDAFQIIINRLKNLTSDINQPKLLIIDDATQDIETYIEKLNLTPDWKTLVTSRNKLFGLDEYELDFLKETDAINLFQLFYKKKDAQNQDIIKTIVNMVGLHTLSIELLAKTAQANRELNLDTLRQKLQNQGLNIDEAVKIKTSYDKVQIETYIFKCLETAFDLAGLSQDTYAIHLLTQFSVLPSQYISYQTLKELLIKDNQNLTLFNEKLNELRDKGWISENEQGFKMHQVMQGSIKDRLNPTLERCKHLVENLNGLLKIKEKNERLSEKFYLLEYTESIMQNLKYENTHLEIAKYLI
jgi:hypothetical protein